MLSQKLKPALAVGALAIALGAWTHNATAETQVERGKYLVTLGGCSDCHTPGSFLGHPDTARFLGGSDVGFAIPGLGVFVGRNLTPDPETGLGKWTTQQIVTAFTTGVRPDGRILAPIMPYEAFKSLTNADARAIAAYLKTAEAGEECRAGAVRPERDADDLRDDGRAWRGLCQHAETAGTSCRGPAAGRWRSAATLMH